MEMILRPQKMNAALDGEAAVTGSTETYVCSARSRLARNPTAGGTTTP